MDSMIKNAQKIKHNLDDYDDRRTIQKFELEHKSFRHMIEEVLDMEGYVVDDGSVNARILQHIVDEAQNRQDLMIQHEEMERNGHDAYIEEEQ